MTIDEFILKMIVDGTMLEECSEGPHGIRELYEAYEPYLEMNDIHKIRFEDIVGAKGGGSEQRQKKVIHDLADYLNIVITQDGLQKICDSLFGNPSPNEDRFYTTFREGQIGSWRQYFSEKHKKLFKEIAGDVLIRWGYEENFDW